MSRPSELNVLPSGYRDLFDRVIARCEGDERVRGLWLSGSLARGTADAASDLDMMLAVADAAYTDFTASWRTWLADITPAVLAAELPFAPGSFYSITPTFERFDVVVEAASAVARTLFRTRIVLLDRDGLTEHIPPPNPAPGPSAARVEELITEYFRVSAVETILVRDDWLLAREHLHVVTSLIYTMFVEANAPVPSSGVKQWSSKLTPDQRTALIELPTSVNNVTELADAHRRVAEVFVTNAEALAQRLEVRWPSELEEAAAAHLRSLLDLAEPYPRTGSVVVPLL